MPPNDLKRIRFFVIAGLCPGQDLVCVVGGPPIHIDDVSAIAHQSAQLGKFAQPEPGGHSLCDDGFDQPLAFAEEAGRRQWQQRLSAPAVCRRSVCRSGIFMADMIESFEL